jgi:KilA-N domain.
MAKQVTVKGIDITYKRINQSEFISLTDIAKFKNPEFPADVVKNWMRSRMTVEFLGVWEQLNNPDFKLVEFDQFKNEAGLHSFVLSPQKWIESTGAIGIVSKSGKGGGTFAHNDIALEFANWISVEFRLYMIKEFQRLHATEQAALEWTAKRELAKINYRIQTDAIKENLIVPELTEKQISYVYANEADLLNVALFGKTAGQWRSDNTDLKGNLRDYASVEQLLVLANLESYNAILIEEQRPQRERIVLLNKTARKQLVTLLNNISVKSDKLLGLSPKDDYYSANPTKSK